MGHNTVGAIPRTTSWKKVIGSLNGLAAVPEVVSATAKAAEGDLLRASDDPVFIEAVRLLLNIPLAARSDDFGLALRNADLSVPDRPELMDLVIAVTERLDAMARESPRRTDLGELAARALARTLSSSIGDELPGLFAATPGDVQAIARNLSWSKGISELTRQFFGALVSECLSYWLDRTLATHTGEGLRFQSAAERGRFDIERDHFTSEATRIIKEFSGGWYGKTLRREGRFRTQEAAQFGAVSLKKIVAELRVREASNG